MDYISLVTSLNILIPEIFLISSTLILLIYGVCKKDNVISVSYISIVTVGFTILLLLGFNKGAALAFNSMFISNNFIFMGKILILLCVLLSIISYIGYVNLNKNINKFEYVILVLLSSVGMLLMVSANDLLNLYLAIELQSLPLYILAAFNRDKSKSTEAGIKYFTLGALSSGLLLYGISLIYGFSGTINFDTIANFTQQNLANNSLTPAFIIGMVLISVGLCFKISAVPFHMWTPDVYQGAPTPVTLFFATAPKLSALILFYRVFNEPFVNISSDWSQILYFVSASSMILGSLAALIQFNIKRLMAYSSIAHVGYMILAVLVGTNEAFIAMLIYFSIYLFAVFGVFSIIMYISVDNNNINFEVNRIKNVKDLSGISKNHPIIAFIMLVLMLSLAGIPPLAGFFGKFYVFSQAIKAGYFYLVVIAVLSSVVGAFYYLRIIKIMYFDEAITDYKINSSSALYFIISLALIINLFFVFCINEWVTTFKHYL